MYSPLAGTSQIELAHDQLTDQANVWFEQLKAAQTLQQNAENLPEGLDGLGVAPAGSE